jgi:hypothetical protein
LSKYFIKRNGEEIFFTDETVIKLVGYTNDYIRLSFGK